MIKVERMSNHERGYSPDINLEAGTKEGDTVAKVSFPSHWGSMECVSWITGFQAGWMAND